MDIREKKKVDIIPRGPITTVSPSIRVPYYNITMKIKDIRSCIIAGAKVYEIIPGRGDKIELNINNYNLDNSNAPKSDSKNIPILHHNASNVKTSPMTSVITPAKPLEVAEEVTVNDTVAAEEPNNTDSAETHANPVQQQHKYLSKKERRALRIAKAENQMATESNESHNVETADNASESEELESMNVDDVMN